MTKTLIVPGLDGSPAPHWQDWWARTDPSAILLEMPDPHRPLREAWEAALASQVLRHPDSILVGHSLGAVTIAHLLARWPGLRIRAALLVAPADPARSARTARFGPLPGTRFDTPAILVSSRSDPWMPPAQSRALAAAWGAQHVDIGLAGHINAEAGFGPWPRGMALRDDLIAQTPRPSALRRLLGLRPLPAQVPAHRLVRAGP